MKTIISRIQGGHKTLNYFLVAVTACAMCAAMPSFAADWTDANGNEYTALKYLKGNGSGSTGGPYIITDFKPVGNSTVKLQFKPTTVSGNECLFCSRRKLPTSGTAQERKTSNSMSGFRTGTKIRLDRRHTDRYPTCETTTLEANKVYSLSADFTGSNTATTGAATINGVDQTLSGILGNVAYTPASLLTLFASHEDANVSASSTFSNKGSYYLYYFQLYSPTDGSLTHNLMPAQNSSGVAGLYDTVTRTFYGPTGPRGYTTFTTEAYTGRTGKKWTGAGADNKMSNGDNWQGGVAPEAGDDIDFTIAVPFAEIDADIDATFGKVWLGAGDLPAFTGSLTATGINDIEKMQDYDTATAGFTFTLAAPSGQDFTWNGGAAANWWATDVWTYNAASSWYDYNNAIFSTADATVTLDAGATVASLAFNANTTIATNGTDAATLTVSSIAVAPGVSAAIGTPISGTTTLAEGTLALADTASLDWSAFTFGAEAAKPVRLDFGPTATLSPVPATWNIGNVANVTSTVVKAGGDWTFSGDVRVGSSAGAVASFYHKGGTISAARLIVGDDNSASHVGTGYCEISGGTVTCLRVPYIGCYSDGSLVVTNGGSLATTASIYLGYSADAVGTITVADGGSISAGEIVMCRNSSNAVGTLNITSGGIVSAKNVWRSNAGSATVNFDGGTFRKASSNGRFFPVNGSSLGVAVTVSANGGTLDNNSLSVTLPCTITGAGSITLSGSGTTTVSADQSYSGTTTVSSETTLSVSGVTFAGPVAFEAGAKLDITNYSAGVTSLAATSLSFPVSGTVPLTLEGGVFPIGVYAICSADGITAADGAKFAPATGDETFAWSVSGDQLFLMVGTASGNLWTGLAGDGKMSTPGNWAGNAVPAAGADVDFSRISSAVTINGDLERTFGAVTMGKGVITFTNSFAATSFISESSPNPTKYIAVAPESTVTLDGDLVFATNQTVYICYTVAAGGTFAVTGDIVGTADQTTYITPCQTDSIEGVISANGLVNDCAWNSLFGLTRGIAGSHVQWLIGEDGISGTARYAVGDRNNVVATITAATNFTISAAIIQYRGLVIDTAGYEITLGTDTSAKSGGILGGGTNGLTTVIGYGKVVVNYNVTNLTPYAVSQINAFMVADGGTLAIASGANPSVSANDNGKLTVNSGATLELPDSATAGVTHNGLLQFGASSGNNNGSRLHFSGLSTEVVPITTSGLYVFSGVSNDSTAIRLSDGVTAPAPGTYSLISVTNQTLEAAHANRLYVDDPLVDETLCTFSIENGDNSGVIKVTISEATAQIGVKKYATITDALASGTASAEHPITLLADTDEDVAILNATIFYFDKRDFSFRGKFVLASPDATLTVFDGAEAPVPTTSVADSYVKATRGEGATIYSVDAYNTVAFDLGGHAMRIGGGELVQKLTDGQDAVAPEIVADFGWLFTGWSATFSNVTASVNVAAQYEQAFALDNAESIDGVAFAGAFDNRSGMAAVRWSASSLPDGLTLSADGVLSGALLTTGRVTFYVTASAMDGENVVAICTFPVSIDVAENPNHRPVVSGTAPTAMPDLTLPGETLAFGVTASDPDGDVLSYFWLIDGVTNAVSATGDFTWTPEELDGGTRIVTCIVSDGFWSIPAKTWRVSIPKWYVSGDGNAANAGTTASAPFREVQQAVDAAEEEDVIFVAEGVYGPVVTANKRIRVLATGALDKTIIDGGGTSRCVYAGDGEGCNNTVFHGFTIRNGRVDNEHGAGARGGTFYDCVFNGNVQTGSSYAGGATSGSCLYNCLLVANRGYNGGGANYGTMVNCTVVGNTASNQGGGTYNGAVRNSIVWGNTCTDGSSSNYYGSAFSYSCTAPLASGTGNICANPYFTAPAEGDYRLLQDSPCLDVGNNAYALGESDLSGTNRVIGTRVDMGAYEGWVYLPLPGEVGGFSAEDGRRIGAVRLAWTAAEYARTYTVCRSVTNTFETFEIIGSTASCFYDDEFAQPETTYWYRVFGVNSNGDGPVGNMDSGWCLGAMTLGANALATATAGLPYNAKLEISGGSGTYTWKTGADDYDVVQGESTYLVSDLVSTGVSGDDNCLSYPLPFDFPFYGKSYNKVWVNSNGTLNFDGNYTGYSADEATFKTKTMIAVFWKDLRTGSGGVGVSTNGGESITFFWNNASYYSGGGAVNASVTLYSDGTVLCSYGSGNASGAFVGVSAGDGVHYRHFNLVGTSLANYDDIRFVPQDVPGGLTLASDGTLSGVAAAPGTYTFTVFVTDSYGNGATQKITLEVESNPNLRTVQFDLGEYGVRAGGGALLQYVLIGESATAPSVRSRVGWVFDGWNRPFTNISENITVSANYRSAYADLHVDVIDLTNVVASGETLNLRWIVGNTGNPSFNGRMTERISLVSAADPNDVRVIASPTFEGLIERDGVIERNVTIDVPLKGWEGVWHVRIETAINPTMQEYAVNNVTTTDATLEITAVPLPNLKVGAPICDANLVPGETAAFLFTTTNSGAAAASAPWTDRVYLESVDSGVAVKVGDISRTNDLNSASAINGEYALTIPEFISVAGAVRVKVVADANGDVVESDDDDNVAYSAETFSLATNLYLTAASTSVYENVSGSGVRFTIRRSGPTTEALAVSLATTGLATVTCPESVTIPAGSVSTVFYVKPIDNVTVEGSRTVTVSASAGDCRPASLALTILDNEVPKLTVALDKTTIREGDGVILATVTRELVTDEPLTVYLAGASTSRCTYPSSVVIPAGEASVTFEISVPNNETAQAAANLTLRASSSGYTSTSVTYTVEDDDVPGVTLSLTPEVVSEGAGAQAIYATLTRSDTNQIAQAVRVRLTASEANQLILPSEITIPKYTMAVRFAIGVVDNAHDDDDNREIDIDGAIVIESCGCNGQSSNGDVIHATVSIIDNDGPALALRADPTTMKEGFDPAGYLVLSHNSTLTEDLTVRLWVDAENLDEIVIPETVTIPAGETSVRIPVATLDDGVEDGGQLVSVYVEDESNVFAPASTWVQVSDQNLPDLKVAKIETVSSVVAMENFTASFAVTNIGFMATSRAIPYAIHLVKGANASAVSSATLVKSGTLTGGLDVGEALNGTVTLTAPELPGDYRVAVVFDPDGTISELDSANNTGWSAALTVGAAYTATARIVGGSVYLSGETVSITGMATRANGSVAANVPVEVYVVVDGSRRPLPVTTEADGSYSVIFPPTSGEAGNYIVGACYPGVNSFVAQDSFSILGMKRSSTSNIIWDYALGDSDSRTVTIQNRSSVPLTGLTVTFTDKPDECEIVPALADTIPANGSVTLTLTATAIGVTEQTNYRKFYVHIEAAEGVSLDFPLYFHSQTQKAYLRPTPTRIDTTMAIGETRYIDVTIVNDGKGDSGVVAATIPSVNWLKIVGGASINNLTNGESAVITLAVSPTAEDGLTLNSPLSGGSLAINCANGSGCSVPLKFTPVSEATGGITVDVVDNNTYTLESAPHLSNATVRVSNPYTGATVATGKTGTDGIWTVDNIPEGTYQLTITAPNHDSYADAITVEPGRNARVEAFLQYQIVSVTWNVEKTEIEDAYDIQLLLDFETQVPAPIVKTYMPDELPTLNEGESYTFTITLENTGLITAEKVTLTMPKIEGYSFSLSDNDIAIPAKSSVNIAAVFSRPAKRAMLMASRSQVTTTTTTKCVHNANTDVSYQCGKEHPKYSYPTKIKHGECTIETIAWITDDSGEVIEIEPSRGDGGGFWSVGGFGSGTGSTYCKKGCDVCYSALLRVVTDCNVNLHAAIDAINTLDERFQKDYPYISHVPDGDLPEANIDDEYMRMMDDSYRKENGRNPLTHTRMDVQTVTELCDGDYHVDETGSIENLDDGFKAAIYTSDSDVILAFAGTDNLKDWIANIINGMCEETTQYAEAADLLNRVYERYKDSGKNIKVVGHSLGGGLAQYAILKNNLGGEVEGITYNSAGLCNTRIPTDIDMKLASESITNYRAPNDYVSLIGYQCGSKYNIPGAYGHLIDGYYTGEGADWENEYMDILQNVCIFARNKSLEADVQKLQNIETGAIIECLERLLNACNEMDAQEVFDAFEAFAQGESQTISFDTGNDEIDKKLSEIAVLYLSSIAQQNAHLATFGIPYNYGIISNRKKTLATSMQYGEWVLADKNEVDKSIIKIFNDVFFGAVNINDRLLLNKPADVSAETFSAFLFENDWSRNLTNQMKAQRVLSTIYESSSNEGYASCSEWFDSVLSDLRRLLQVQSDAVCASVTLKLSQTLAMTREAFDGTLTLYNGNTTTPITNLKLDVSVLDEDGNECKDLFEIFANGTSGDMSDGSALAGGLSVSAGGTGSAMIRFIPERGAAPTEEKLYRFGGTVAYTDPFSGETATVKLTPVSLTVSPSPYLHLDYFVQRDVFADDPFTPDVVEASMPAELAVLVRNVGGGNANKVTIASAQPEMVQNEKGLSAAFNLKDYTLEASALNGATAHLGLNTVSLGTIEPNESKVAQWWLTSTIEGHFIGMSATVTPVNSWNTPDTALVDPNVGVHKLVRSIVADGDTLPDFLVCDGSDLYGKPNEIYTARGDQLPVYVATVSASTTLSAGSEIELPISLTPAQSGWNYGYATIPGLFRYTISRIVRGDGTEISLRNVWVTDRTFRDSNTPLLEDRLHIVDEFASNATQMYTVYLTAKPSDVPEVVAFEGVPDGVIEYAARDFVTVVFSKPINTETFTTNSLMLVRQGVYLGDLSALTITPADDSGTRFTIGNLSALCDDYGRYELTVQCAGIADTVGQLGTFGKSIAWTYATPEAPYVIGADGVPVRRVQSLDTISVTFSAPIKPETFTSAALRMNNVAIGSGVTIAALDASATRFSLSGLSSVQTADGEYTLAVDATAVAGLDDTLGVNTYTVTWIRDTVAPVLQSLTHEVGLNGNEFTLSFSEEVESDSLTPNGATIRRNGATVALPATASVRLVGDNASCQYVLSGIDFVFAEDGEYELTFSANGVTDEAGNVASGSKSVAWTVDNTPPAEIADLAISPDGGFSDTDGITYTGALTVTGTLPEAGLTVEIIAKYVGGSETVLATMPSAGGDSLPAGAFSQDVVMPGTGNATLVVRLTDAAGISSDTELSVFVDGIVLTGTLTGASEDEGVVTTSATLTFSDKVTDGDVTLEKFSLTRDGEAVALVGVTFAKVNDTTYTLTGLDSLCAEDGVYVLTFNGAVVRKYTSGLTMGGSLVMRWRYENPDREPPTVTAVLFDGETPHDSYTNVFSTVAVTFSEAVNVPELIARELIGKAARIDLLDAAGVVTGCVAAARSASAPYQWNGESNTLSWMIDPLSVPAGRTRLMIDAGLIEDLAGNRLAAEGYAATNGMRTYTLSDTVLAQVHAQAMPTWYNGELYVGEKTADNKGKIRVYSQLSTSWAYLRSEGVDIEIPAQGCQGASVAFADMDGDGVAETYVGTATGNVLKYPGGETIASLGANRAMPYAYDIDGDGCDELITGGMDGRIRVISRDADAGTYSVALVSDVNGSALTVPNGRAAPVVADINHDGIADIVSGDTAGNIWAYLGDGNAWCAQPLTVFTNNVSLADRSRLGYGDVDGDGIEDLIVGRSDGSVTVMLGAETPSPIVPFAVKAVVSASAGAHGEIAPVGDTTYDGGDTPEYVITPDIGYHVADVLVDGVSIGATNSYVFAPLTTSHTISADFAVTPYAITYTGLMGATNPNPATYTVEDAITFVAPGDVYGWVFKGWTPESIALGTVGAVEVTANWERQKFDVTVNGETRQYSYEAEVRFTAPEPQEADGIQIVTLGTTFTDPVVTNEFTVTVTNGIDFTWDILATNWWFAVAETQNGAIVAPESCWTADGTNFVLAVEPAAHYHFVGWTGDTNGCEAVGAQLSVVMDQARTIGATFAIDTFAVAFDAGAHGALSGEPAQTIDYGATATVPEVTPDAGYRFVGWSGNVTAPIDSDATFTAQYEAIQYAITYTGLKGTMNNNPATYTVEDAITFAAPGDVYGWVFKGWTPASIALGSIGDVEVSANWERQKFDVTVNGETTQYSYEEAVTFTAPEPIEANGMQVVTLGTTFTDPVVTNEFTVTVTNGIEFTWDILATNWWFETVETLNGFIIAPDAGWMADGTNFVLAVEPAAHYHFVGWTGNTNGCEAVGAQLSVVMGQARTIGATFAIDTFAVTFEAGAHGAFSGETAQTIDYGATATVPEVTPDAGYEFTGWSGDVSAPVTSNATFVAQYAAIPYAITYMGLKGAMNNNPATYTVEDAITFAAPGDVYGWVFKGWSPASIVLGTTGAVEVTANWERQKFDVTVNGETRQYSYEAEVRFTAPEPQEADGIQIVTLGTTFTDPVVTNEFTVTVTNGIDFTWDILATNWWFAVAETQNGAIVASESCWMADGTNFVLAVEPAAHYHFVGWTGDTNGCEAADAQLSVVMDQARTIGATFAIDTFAVAFDAGAHGALSGETAQTIDYGATATVPEVTPDAGYEFTGWSGDVSAPVTSNATFVAQYAAIPYAIIYTGLMGATNPNPATYTVEDAITFAAPGDVYGWVFKGWTHASIVLGTTGEVEVTANWERAKFDVTVNGETTQYSYEDVATFVTNAVVNACATQYVCKGWTATNADPAAGDSAMAEFRVLGDVSFNWLWDTNVVALAQSVNAEGLEWTTGGAAGWQPEWSYDAEDGVHHAHSGAIGNNTNSWIETTLMGAGTLSYAWRSSTEAKYDTFQLIVDGEVKGSISGETVWTTNVVVLAGGSHVVRWNYRKSRSGSAGADAVWLDSVTWTAEALPPDVPPTLAEALNPDLFWTTEGDVAWTAVRKESVLDARDDWATAGGLSDYGSSVIETAVYGAGVVTFEWAVSCEDGYDWFDFAADGEVRESITGETGWRTVTVEITGDGRHDLRWEYWKDEMDEEGLVCENRARLDNVRWTPASPESQYTVTTPVPVPFAAIRTAYSNYWTAAEGDYEAAAHAAGRNGCAVWESYVAGLDPDDEDSKFTAKISMVGGEPVVTWSPDTPELRATRIYTVLGKKALGDAEWKPATEADKDKYNFFKVDVKLK